MTPVSTSDCGEISSLYKEIAATEEELKDSPLGKGLRANMSRIRHLVADLGSSNRTFAEIQTLVKQALQDLRKPSAGCIEARAAHLSMQGSARLSFRERVGGEDHSLPEIPFPEEVMQGGSSQSEKPSVMKDRVSETFSDPAIRVKLAGVSSEGPTPEGATLIAEVVTSVVGKVGQVVRSTIDGIGEALGKLEGIRSDIHDKILHSESSIPPHLKEYHAQIARDEARYTKIKELNNRMRSDPNYNRLGFTARFEIAESIVGGFKTEQQVKAQIAALVKQGPEDITVDESGNLILNKKIQD